MLLICIILASHYVKVFFILFALQHTGLKGSIEPLLEEADIDHDGKISLHEFRRLLKTASIKSRNVRNPPGYLISRKA